MRIRWLTLLALLACRKIGVGSYFGRKKGPTPIVFLTSIDFINPSVSLCRF
jgi:hypothetical protein